MAILSAQGFGGMPKHCAALMGALFGGAMLVCALRDALPQRYARLVPSPMAISIPFYLGANNAINFWVRAIGWSVYPHMGGWLCGCRAATHARAARAPCAPKPRAACSAGPYTTGAHRAAPRVPLHARRWAA